MNGCTRPLFRGSWLFSRWVKNCRFFVYQENVYAGFFWKGGVHLKYIVRIQQVSADLRAINIAVNPLGRWPVKAALDHCKDYHGYNTCLTLAINESYWCSSMC